MNDQDFGDEIVPEEWPTVFTQVPVWVLLSGSTAQAYRMYAFLAEHINSRRTGKDRIAFPSMKAIARALGLKDQRDVKKYREELERLGAVRSELAPYAGGLRRRYKYRVRFNPPAGHTGPTSLAEFYDLHPDVRSQKKTAGQPQGGKNPTLEGGEKPTSRTRENPTLKKRDQEQPDQQKRDAAPSARSAVDGRQASAGSRGSRGGGVAASGKTNPPPLSSDDKRRYEQTVAVLPPVLAGLVPRNAPRELKQAVLDALAAGTPASRTAEQLVEFRLMPKWRKHYGSQDGAGEIRRPVGVLLAMLVRNAECGDDRCDERTNVDTGEACRSCEMRVVDRRADRVREQGPSSSQEPAGGVPGPRTEPAPAVPGDRPPPVVVDPSTVPLGDYRSGAELARARMVEKALRPR